MNLTDVATNPRKKLALLAKENELSLSFDCAKCHHQCQAICCSNVPLDPKLIKHNAHRIQRKIVEFIKIMDLVIPMTESGRCPFLTQNLKCAIYKWRPPICRLFGTELDPMLTCHFQDKNGNERLISDNNQ